jgi:hypothetical protein
MTLSPEKVSAHHSKFPRRMQNSLAKNGVFAKNKTAKNN